MKNNTERFLYQFWKKRIEKLNNECLTSDFDLLVYNQIVTHKEKDIENLYYDSKGSSLLLEDLFDFLHDMSMGYLTMDKVKSDKYVLSNMNSSIRVLYSSNDKFFLTSNIVDDQHQVTIVIPHWGTFSISWYKSRLKIDCFIDTSTGDSVSIMDITKILISLELDSMTLDGLTEGNEVKVKDTNESWTLAYIILEDEKPFKLEAYGDWSEAYSKDLEKIHFDTDFKLPNKAPDK